MRPAARAPVVLALVAALCAPAAARAGDAAAPSAQVVPSERAAPPEEGPASGWTTASSADLVGRGVGISGDEHKYREDHDTLESGGGAYGTTSAWDTEGHYLDLDGAVLGQRAGDDLDGGAIHVRGGRWGRYSIAGDLEHTQAFYDDSWDGPRLNSFPFTDTLGRTLTTTRTNGRVALGLWLGDRGHLDLTYRHRETDGNRSLLKGSIVESVAPFAFRFPAFEAPNVRSDAVDVAADLPAGPLSVRLSSGFTNEHDRTSVHETNFGPDALRDETRFRNDLSLTLVRAGAEVTTPATWPVYGNGGYQFLYADVDGTAAQADGPTGSTLVRTADGIAVTERTHTGHLGFTLSPLRDLIMRAGYTMLDRSHDGSAREQRRDQPGGAVASTVLDDGNQDLQRHRPRLEISYTGLARTLLRARYTFEYSWRDFDVTMLGAPGDPLTFVDRIERTNEDRTLHRLLAEWRVRASAAVLLGGGYEYLREDVDEDIHQLVNEVTLGDRNRERHGGFAHARFRPWARTMVELRGEIQREHFDRPEIPGDSSTTLDAKIASLRMVTALTTRLMLTSLIAAANRDYDVGQARRTLSSFRPIEFRGGSTTCAFTAAYTLDERTTLQGQYSIVNAGGSLDNLNQRLFLAADRSVGEHLRLAVGYAFLDFDQGLYGGDDFTGHMGWTRATFSF